jgi:endogenous inhibitor of DNA gyrase (YacG/DUF329 family)
VLNAEEYKEARRLKWLCCAECGKQLPERGFCSAACQAMFEAELPYWDALERGVPRHEAEALLPASCTTRKFLALAALIQGRSSTRQ